ncbi:MFS transporter [Oceanobacillus damuensis]|uniref:MFS transporter n=1 Tax=Oceanobacillus damuensis TaxID=937928 RepID=UPI000837A656|nr:MFS transporter [Oceanobacillus damuensis]
MKALFTNRNYMLLWTGLTVSRFGYRFFNLSIIWFVLRETGDAMALGMTVLCFTIPTVLIEPFAGVLADRYDKKKIMVITDFCNGVIMLIIATLMISGALTLPVLYILLVCSAIATALFNPSANSSIPLLVEEKLLPKANSLNQLSTQGSNILGPALAGILIDRTHRKLVLVVTDIGRGVMLIIICLTAILNVISIGWLMVMMIIFGIMSIFNDAAYQSLVPEIVPRPLLIWANARLEQSAAVAETSGPAISGGLIALIGAPFTFLINAFSYLSSGILMASIKHKPSERPTANPMKLQIKEGVRWVYRHRYLRTMALNTHVWFFFHSMTITVLVTFVLIELQFSSLMLGFVLAAAGIGAVCGTSLSTYFWGKWDIGRTMVLSRALYSPAVILIVLAPSGQHDEFQVSALSMVLAGQFIYGLAMGIEGPLEMGYRQSITSMRLQGRTNATMRSINRSMIVIGAPFGGAIADFFGFRTALRLAVIGLAICAIWFAFFPMRNAKLDDDNQNSV